jgi:predicted RNase H-like HicB family nuclease
MIFERSFVMKFIYPAVFHKTDSGRFEGYFPDLEDCHVQGDTLEEAVDNANEAAYNWISSELMEEDWDLPPVSDEHDIEREAGDVIRNIAVTIRLFEGWDE